MTRTVVALCLLAIFCTVDAFYGFDPMDGLARLRNQLQRAKAIVNSNIRTLKRLNSEIPIDTKIKAQNKFIKQFRNHINYVNSIIDAIRAEVGAAKAEGKNAQPCFDNALEDLRQISLPAKKDGDRCVKSATKAIKNELGFMDGLFSTGRQLNAQLDNIFPNCYDSNFVKMQTCIATQLDEINIAVRNLQKDINSAINTVNSGSNHVVLQASNCVSDVYSNAHSKITDVRLSVTKCIKTL